MKVNFVVFSDDIPIDIKLCKINNKEIKTKERKIVTRTSNNVNVREFLAIVLSNKAFWKYRTYDMNNKRKNIWFIKKKDYDTLVREENYDNK